MIGQGKVEFRLKIESYGLPYTMINAELEVENRGNEKILVPETENLWELVEERVFSFEVEGAVDKSCYTEKIMREKLISGLKYQDLGKGKKKRYNSKNIGWPLGILDEGTYQIKGIWDSRNQARGHKDYWESEWITIELKAGGEDKMLIEDFKEKHPMIKGKEMIGGYKCLLMDLPYNKNLREYVLEKYPTSTYAGWVLYNFDIDWYTRGTCSICDEKIIKDINEIGFFKALENLRNSKKEIERKEKREKTIEFLEKFIKEHPEFPFIGYYYATLADKYLIKGDIKKACENYKKSLELEWNLPRISKKETEIQKGYAEKAYGYLEKNGVCK